MDIDTSANAISILVSPSAPYFRISAMGDTGETEIEYPKETSVFDSFVCQELVEHSYKFSVLQSSLKALSSSKKTSLRLNEEGQLNLQVTLICLS